MVIVMANKFKGKFTKKKVIKIVIILAVIIIVIALIYRSKTKNGSSQYVQQTAETGDVNVYHSFTGTVAAVNSQNVMSAVSGIKVTEVNVKEGDTVKAGDVIAKLDTTAIDEQISEKEITMSQTSKSQALSVKSAEKSYKDLTQNIEDGLDSTRQGAQNSIDSAYVALLNAMNAYNNEVSLNNEQLSSTILSAINAVDSASRSLEAAELSTKQAKDAKAHAQSVAEENGLDYDAFSNDQGIKSLEMSEESARAAYDNAVKSYKIAKITEENSLTQLFDNLITAQNSYFAAIDSFNATIRAQEQQLEGYKIAIEQAKLGTDNTLSQMQLDDLKKQREENYTLTAPIDGQITKLSAKTGDITAVSATTSLATITDYSTMKVNIKVGEYDITSISEGDKVSISVPAIDKDYEGEISHIDKEATSSSGVSYFNAEVRFSADEDIRSGLSAEVKLDVINEKGVVTIPNESIMTDDDGSAYVYIRENEKSDYTKRKIICGSTDGQITEVKEGLVNGEEYYYDALSASMDISMDGSSEDMETGAGDGTDGAGVSIASDGAAASN